MRAAPLFEPDPWGQVLGPRSANKNTEMYESVILGSAIELPGRKSKISGPEALLRNLKELVCGQRRFATLVRQRERERARERERESWFVVLVLIAFCTFV